MKKHSATEETVEEQAEQKHVKHAKKSHSKESNWMVWAIGIAALVILFNQWQLFALNGMLGGPSVTGGKTVLSSTSTPITESGKFYEMDAYHIYAPVLLEQGEQPVLANYKTNIKLLPTISGHAIPEKSSGDATQDAINALVPTGTPDYGQAAGVSFDDPIGSQKVLGGYDKSIQLSEAETERYQRIVGAFTCDYCCGSPSRPTIITNCGCAHARAWRGLTKWFIKNTPDTEDLKIFGELSKWKTLWYPGPTIQRVLQELGGAGSAGAGQGGSTAGGLPTMVGGC